VKWRMRTRWLWASTAVAVVALAAVLPLWLATPPTQATSPSPERQYVPWEFYSALVDECDGDRTDTSDVMLANSIPGPDGDRLRFDMYRLDPQAGTVNLVDPVGTELILLEAANKCLAPYTLVAWPAPPPLDEFHRNIYYDYVAGVLAPCLVEQGLEAPVPARGAFVMLDVNSWYFQRVEQLPFSQGMETWRNCPPVPEYLKPTTRPAELTDLLT
jgi:hypothetical protein